MDDLNIDEVRTHWQQSVRPKIASALENLSQKDRCLFRRIFADRAEPETIADELDLESRDEGVVFVTSFKTWLVNQLREWGVVGGEMDDNQVENLLKIAGASGLGQPRENTHLGHLERFPNLDRPPGSASAIPGENNSHLDRERTRKIELKNVFQEELLQRRLPWAGPAIEIVQKPKGEGKALFYVSAVSRSETENPASSSHLSSPMGLLFREAGKDQPQAVLLTEERPAAVVPETLPTDWSEVTLDLYIEPPELVEEPEPKALLWIGSEFFPLQPQGTSEERSWRVKGLDYEKLSRYRESQPPVRVEHPNHKIPPIRLDEFDKIPPGDQETGPKEQSPGRDRPEPRPVFTGHVSGWRLVFSSTDSSSVFLQVEEKTDAAVTHFIQDLDSREFYHPTSAAADTLSDEDEEPSKTEIEINLREELGSETAARRLPWLRAIRLGRYETGEKPLYYVEGEEKEVSKSSNVALELHLHDHNSGKEGKAELKPRGEGTSLQFFMPKLSADWKELTLILELPPINNADN